MAERQVPRDETIAPLAHEIHIEVNEHTSGDFPGYVVMVVRQQKIGPDFYDTQKLLVKRFMSPSHDDVKKRHDANGLAEGLGKIFGIMDVRKA